MFFLCRKANLTDLSPSCDAIPAADQNLRNKKPVYFNLYIIFFLRCKRTKRQKKEIKKLKKLQKTQKLKTRKKKKNTKQNKIWKKMKC